MPRKAKLLFDNRVCLAVNEPDLPKVQAAARDFRPCTKVVKLGPAVATAHGPTAIRSMHELGAAEIILDVRLCGHAREVWNAVTEAARLWVSGITVQACVGPDVLAAAVEAAENSTTITHKVKAPAIIATLLPVAVTDDVMRGPLAMRYGRRRYVGEIAKMCCNAGVNGLQVDYYDIRPIRQVCKNIPLVASAKRGVRNYAEVITDEQQKLPGVTEVLRAGAAHVLFPAELATTDYEWTADLLAKEVSQWADGRRKKTDRASFT